MICFFKENITVYKGNRIRLLEASEFLTLSVTKRTYLSKSLFADIINKIITKINEDIFLIYRISNK